jgi:C4-dicarboxylate-specific signal transduction histidine kinase
MASAFVVAGLTAAQTGLIALLLFERFKRIRAQRSLHEQWTFNEMLAGLKTDAVRHAPGDTSHALEHAIARIGRYSGAGAAQLLVHGALTPQPSEVVRWSDEGSAASSTALTVGIVTAVEIPLRSDATRVGTLTLEGLLIDRIANTSSRERLEAAADLLAAAIARAEAERMLAESRRHVEHMGRVTMMAKLGAAMSHELRQPLTAILANAEAGQRFLEGETPDVSQAREVFHDIVAGHARAMDVIEHVRALVRKEAHTSEPVSLNDVCRKAATLLQREAESKRVSLDFTLARAMPAVVGDPVQLQQVAINLVMNAIESASASKRERRVEVHTASHGAEVELVVSDSGAGFSPHVQQHLFESFFSTKKDGMGMGLTIVQQIAAQHGGVVRAHNASGGGAILQVTLPAGRVVPGGASARLSEEKGSRLR